MHTTLNYSMITSNYQYHFISLPHSYMIWMNASSHHYYSFLGYLKTISSPSLNNILTLPPLHTCPTPPLSIHSYHRPPPYLNPLIISSLLSSLNPLYLSLTIPSIIFHPSRIYYPAVLIHFRQFRCYYSLSIFPIFFIPVSFLLLTQATVI